MAQALAHAPSVDELAATLKNFGLAEVPKAPNTHPELNPFDIYRSHITELLSQASGVDPKIIYPTLQWTQSLEKGDLTLAVPALRLKGKKPDELAKEIAEKFPESPLVEKPTVLGTFLQFFFKPAPLNNLVIPSILKSGNAFGLNPTFGLKDPADPSKGRKKIIIEFSSPNIAKPFGYAHLRSTIIGGFLAKLYESAGWEVIRMNYLGDWGRQYGILAVGYGKFGDEAKLKADPIKHLVEVYQQMTKIQKEEDEQIKKKQDAIAELKKQGKEDEAAKAQPEVDELVKKSVSQQARDYFKRMEEGDKEAMEFWKWCRDVSIEALEKSYARLNVHYDVYSGESQVKEESMEAAAKLLESSGTSENSEGAVIVDLTKHSKKLGKALVKKKDGTSLYLTRDIGAAVERYNTYSFDKMIYVVATQQDLHLAQLFKIIELMGRKDIADKCQHINFGMVNKMSTRLGTAKALDEVLNIVGEKMHEVMKSNQAKYEQVADPEKTADVLGISAVMVQDMKGKRINNYDFDLSRMTSFEGDTGPYLEYAHARLCSIVRKADIKEEDLVSADLSLLTEKHAIDVVRVISQWPDVFVDTLKKQEPATVLTYLFKMTHAVSSSYDHLQVVGSEESVKKARMALYVAARQVLRNGLALLGITPVERM
ncbi:putative arginyl-trna synthetase protein [Neofusicoccum parvum UCRNP2]|uniref:arginine--tRNA ligase n=1 Tax=Botryosphaeria parva (strain UCR-NP2) TaxID=1287680 RepID=R1GQ18_BOTPV|nr:putative arginyl-trna synthetase protein [Neofusicoccum parvum UCRNP2]